MKLTSTTWKGFMTASILCTDLVALDLLLCALGTAPPYYLIGVKSSSDGLEHFASVLKQPAAFDTQFWTRFFNGTKLLNWIDHLQKMKCYFRKSPGADSIPPQLYKAGGNQLVRWLSRSSRYRRLRPYLTISKMPQSSTFQKERWSGILWWSSSHITTLHCWKNLHPCPTQSVISACSSPERSIWESVWLLCWSRDCQTASGEVSENTKISIWSSLISPKTSIQFVGRSHENPKDQLP